jgi:TrmH family RNA methyltransferase
MLTKNNITYLRSLQEKRWRNEAWAFLVEWEKNILEFLDSDFVFLEGYFTPSFREKIGSHVESRRIQTCSENEIQKITSLASNTTWVAVFAMKKDTKIHSEWIVLVLDNINDPGNFGTIIRTADWYGVKNIIASLNTVDMYNPKVIMAYNGIIHASEYILSRSQWLSQWSNVTGTGSVPRVRGYPYLQNHEWRTILLSSEANLMEYHENLLSTSPIR